MRVAGQPPIRVTVRLADAKAKLPGLREGQRPAQAVREGKRG